MAAHQQASGPRDLSEEERRWAAVTEATVRLSVGLEDAGDLVEDLSQALGWMVGAG